ncbi:hypothetical protein B0H17DRAFT_1204852 [Mycena rosella]|uniref:Uncharacterized protein n=1 Tax=Mycena rosella TaxID=1033263 RepID=A0AAD7GAT9_MYCRO|nr:hypothetical protein B0H17DRAFT_1204852 [Mycena rosella]
MSDRSMSSDGDSSCSPRTVFKYSDCLFRTALSLPELDSEERPWRPEEPWAIFFEKRLRPMVYWIHAAVTHEFTFVGCKGFYDDDEHREIVASSSSQFTGNWGITIPCAWDVPGEATAMFEILYHLCMSVGFPEVHDPELVVNRFTLLPLICEACKTRAFFNTPMDYHHYTEHGELTDPLHFHSQNENALEWY